MATRIERIFADFWWPCGHFFLIFTDLALTGLFL
jgi:hypothetical protein